MEKFILLSFTSGGYPENNFCLKNMSEIPSQETPEKEWSRFQSPKQKKEDAEKSQQENDYKEILTKSFLWGFGCASGVFIGWTFCTSFQKSLSEIGRLVK